MYFGRSNNKKHEIIIYMNPTQLLFLYLLTIHCVKNELKAVLKGVLMLHLTCFFILKKLIY